MKDPIELIGAIIFLSCIALFVIFIFKLLITFLGWEIVVGVFGMVGAFVFYIVQ